MICEKCRKKLKNVETMNGCNSCDCIFFKDDKEMKGILDKFFNPKSYKKLTPLTKKQIKYLAIFQVMCKYCQCEPESQHGIEIIKFINDNKAYIKRVLK